MSALKYIREELAKAHLRKSELVTQNSDDQSQLIQLKAEVKGKYIDPERYKAVCDLQTRYANAIVRRTRELVVLKNRIRLLANQETEAKEARQESSQPCVWTEERAGVWMTDCGEDFTLDEETPSGNGMKFCCFCGLELVDGSS